MTSPTTASRAETTPEHTARFHAPGSERSPAEGEPEAASQPADTYVSAPIQAAKPPVKAAPDDATAGASGKDGAAIVAPEQSTPASAKPDASAGTSPESGVGTHTESPSRSPGGGEPPAAKTELDDGHGGAESAHSIGIAEGSEEANGTRTAELTDAASPVATGDDATRRIGMAPPAKGPPKPPADATRRIGVPPPAAAAPEPPTADHELGPGQALPPPPWYRRPGILIAAAFAALIAVVGIIVSGPGEPGTAPGRTTGTNTPWSASFSMIATTTGWFPTTPTAPPPAAPPAAEPAAEPPAAASPAAPTAAPPAAAPRMAAPPAAAPRMAAPRTAAPRTAAPPAAAPPAAQVPSPHHQGFGGDWRPGPPPPPPPSELQLRNDNSLMAAFVSITNNAGKPAVGCVYRSVAVAGPATMVNYNDTVDFTVYGSEETRIDYHGPATGSTFHRTVTCDNGLSTSQDVIY
jgi:hypothetical protein